MSKKAKPSTAQEPHQQNNAVQVAKSSSPGAFMGLMEQETFVHDQIQARRGASTTISSGLRASAVQARVRKIPVAMLSVAGRHSPSGSFVPFVLALHSIAVPRGEIRVDDPAGVALPIILYRDLYNRFHFTYSMLNVAVVVGIVLRVLFTGPQHPAEQAFPRYPVLDQHATLERISAQTVWVAFHYRDELARQ